LGKKFLNEWKCQERVPERGLSASGSFSPEAFEYWMAVLVYPWVMADFVWTACCPNGSFFEKVMSQ
jgi:hypothetical protein